MQRIKQQEDKLKLNQLYGKEQELKNEDINALIMEEIKYYENIDHSKVYENYEDYQREKELEHHEAVLLERKRQIRETEPLRYKMKIGYVKGRKYAVNEEEDVAEKRRKLLEEEKKRK